MEFFSPVPANPVAPENRRSIMPLNNLSVHMFFIFLSAPFDRTHINRANTLALRENNQRIDLDVAEPRTMIDKER